MTEVRVAGTPMEIEQARREAETETRKEIALTLFSRGEDVYEIAEIVRANPNTVGEWVGLRKKFAYRDEWHLRSPEARALYREGEIEAIREIAPNLAEAGFSVTEIARLMNEDEQTVAACLQDSA